MAAISSVQRIGWPVSASTLAAASRALRRLLAASVGSAASIFRALEALAVLGDGGGFFFGVAMILLLGGSNPQSGIAPAAMPTRHRTVTSPTGKGSRPSGAKFLKRLPVSP